MLAPSTTTTRLPRRSISSINWRRPLVLLLLTLPLAGHAAQRELLQLFVTEPYLELHTGPGRGYPVSQVVARGDSVDVLFRHTEWYKVRTERGVEGWASEDSLLRTMLADGSAFKVDRGNLKVEMYGGQFLGNIYNGYIVDLGLNHVFMPEWRFSPFVTLGTGLERVEPRTTLVRPINQNYQTAYVGFGGRYYLARRFFLRAEYRSHTVFTNTDSNEVKTEWKFGFAFFY
jgi:uncharacterized protein YgiM (DUF1202 family)